ncbi:porin [Terasakiella sp. SH-1]|uniref:porin n=1 Tax=Terasakiella sp. SH-1 TaxID=2560057 RepID=UPI0010748C9A|nr:porin [Terasakiella sp. SH-1]
MKKVILRTTAISALCLGALSAQAADPIELNISGFMKQWVGYTEHSINKLSRWNYSNVGTYSDAEIYFSGSTKLDNGLSVGVMMETERSGGTSDGNTDESYGWISSDSYGKIQVGRTDNVSTEMAYKARDVGIGLNKGDVEEWRPSAQFATDVAYTTALVGSSLEIQPPGIHYYSPVFNGFQFGFSHLISATESQEGSYSPKRSAQAFALSYSGEWNDLKIGADLSKVQKRYVSDRNFYRAGLDLEYEGFSLSGSYKRTSNLEDRNATTGYAASIFDGQTWEAGLGYETGPYSVTAAYLSGIYDANSTVSGAKSDLNIAMISGAYDLGAGVTFRGSVFRYDVNGYGVNDISSSTIVDNISKGVVLGMEVAF